MISIRVTEDRFPNYFSDSDHDRVIAWQDGMCSLAALGWIALDWGKGAEHHRIARIRLKVEHSRAIEQAVGRMGLCDFRGTVLKMITEHEAMITGNGPEWLLKFFSDERARLADSEPVSDRRPEIIHDLGLIYTALMLISRTHHGIDGHKITWRQFSVANFSDTKVLNRFKPQIARILAKYGLGEDSTDLDDSAVLSHFGIGSKEEILLLSGCIHIKGDGFEIDGAKISPFFAIAENAAFHQTTTLDLTGIKAVLTIENMESFHSWCINQFKKDWLCMYLAGFPSSGKIRLLRQIAETGCQFFHWSDLDCGGIRIHLFLESAISKSITPYGMDPKWLKELSPNTQPLSTADIGRLKHQRNAIRDEHPLLPLVDALIDGGRKLEQEAILQP